MALFFLLIQDLIRSVKDFFNVPITFELIVGRTRRKLERRYNSRALISIKSSKITGSTGSASGICCWKPVNDFITSPRLFLIAQEDAYKVAPALHFER